MPKPVKNYLFARSLLLISVFLLSACSVIGDLKDTVLGVEQVNPPSELFEIKATAQPKILWSGSVGDSDYGNFTPAVFADFVYAASASGEVVKFNALTGKQLWRMQAAEQLTGGVGAGPKTVLVGGLNGEFLAFNTDDGKPLWKTKLSSIVTSAAVEAGSIVVVRTGDGKIFGLDAADGKRKWVYERSVPALSVHSSAGLVVDSDVAYAGFAGGKLAAVRVTDGRLLWEATVAQPKGTTEIDRITDITSLPVVDGKLIYAVAYQGKVVAIDRANGRVVWDRDISSYAGLGAEDARVFVTHTNGAVYALEFETGKSYWRQADLKFRELTAPIGLGSAVAVGDFEGYVHFMSREDGAFVARIKTDNSAVMPQMLNLGARKLLLQTRQGGIYAIELN